MKKLLLPLTILLFFGLVVSSCSSDDVLQRENNEQPNIVKRNNEKAREAGIRLLESFGMTKTRSLSTSDYPDYYGGSYINGNGKLVVFLKGEIESTKATLIRLIGENDVIYTQGNYSYTELNNVLTKITSFISSNKDSQIAKNIRYYYLNDFENCVVVELDKSNEMEIKEFKSEVTPTVCRLYLPKRERTVSTALLASASGTSGLPFGSRYLSTNVVKPWEWKNGTKLFSMVLIDRLP